MLRTRFWVPYVYVAPAVILLGLVLVTGYRRAVRNLRQDTATKSLWLAYFVAAVIYSLTEAGFRIFTPVWIALLLSIFSVFKPQYENAGLQTVVTAPRIFRGTGSDFAAPILSRPTAVYETENIMQRVPCPRPSFARKCRGFQENKIGF